MSMEIKLKHLDHIQAIIGRLATNSFLFKGWAITLATALASFAAVQSKVGLVVIAAVSTLLFWGLDGYYLWLERGFRKLYETSAALHPSAVDFSMKIDRTRAARTWARSCVRWHLVSFYGALLLMDLVGIYLLRGATDGA
ncbi:hypothetical protein [Geodermatophilus sp. SYSU D01176]